MIVVDANGLGAGLIDYLVKPTTDEDQGVTYPPFGVTNDDRYDKYKTDDTIEVLYNIKANAETNSEMHVNLFSQMSSKKIKFLGSEKVEKLKMDSIKKWQDAAVEKRAEHLKPYMLTTILKEEMMNLRVRKSSGASAMKIALERVNNRIPKDKFSALEYALLYIKELDDAAKDKRKRRGDASKNMFFTKHKGPNRRFDKKRR